MSWNIRSIYLETEFGDARKKNYTPFITVKQILQEFESDSSTSPTLSAYGEVINSEEKVSAIVEEHKTNRFLLHTSGVQKHSTRDVEFEKKNVQTAVIIDHVIRDLWNSYDHSSTLLLAFLANLSPQNGVDGVFDAIRYMKQVTKPAEDDPSQVTANISSPITASTASSFATENDESNLTSLHLTAEECHVLLRNDRRSGSCSGIHTLFYDIAVSHKMLKHIKWQRMVCLKHTFCIGRSLDGVMFLVDIGVLRHCIRIPNSICQKITPLLAPVSTDSTGYDQHQWLTKMDKDGRWQVYYKVPNSTEFTKAEPADDVDIVYKVLLERGTAETFVLLLRGRWPNYTFMISVNIVSKSILLRQYPPSADNIFTSDHVDEKYGVNHPRYLDAMVKIKDIIAGREEENQYRNWRIMMNLVLGDWEAVADRRKAELISKGELDSVWKDLPLDLPLDALAI